VKPADVGAAFLVRMVALASVAVIGSAWGLTRFYTHARAPMLVPVPHDAGGARDSGEADAGGRWIEAPEIEVVPR
jgi:hypothetical protein